MPVGPILVVDDEPLNLDAIREALKDNYRLAFATSGVDALAAAHRHHPALILLDIQMPGMDGYETCRQLKADPRTAAIPVIFVTSLSETPDETYGFQVGAVDYITKPIHPAIVQVRVANQLNLVRASELEQSYRDAITMLGEAGHFNDTDTGLHIWRMAAYARAIAAATGWSEEACALLELAAPMHDTGKIGIPGTLLRKPGKLDADEWVVMRTHTTIGHEILSKSNAPVFQLAAELALRHHEKWDGSGYPDGLAGTAIPESARIVALADVFDALTMKRPYKDAWPIERVIRFVEENTGTHFEPRLIEIFTAILPQLLEIKETWDTRENAMETQK